MMPVTDYILLVHSEFLKKGALEVNFKIGQAICTMKYANKLVLLAKKETVLQDVIDRRT
jgi:hypothetical protein